MPSQKQSAARHHHIVHIDSFHQIAQIRQQTGDSNNQSWIEVYTYSFIIQLLQANTSQRKIEAVRYESAMQAGEKESLQCKQYTTS